MSHRISVRGGSVRLMMAPRQTGLGLNENPFAIRATMSHGFVRCAAVVIHQSFLLGMATFRRPTGAGIQQMISLTSRPCGVPRDLARSHTRGKMQLN
jgi:hypothetical protein